VILDAVFYRFGTWGIPLSTAVCNVAGTVALLVLLRRHIGRIDGGEIAASTIRIVAASAVVAVVAFGVWYPLDAALGRSFGGQVVSVGLASAASVAAYAIACRALSVREMQALLSLRNRAGRG
jgi:putative peptidoglycan lipid II flippase